MLSKRLSRRCYDLKYQNLMYGCLIQEPTSMTELHTTPHDSPETTSDKSGSGTFNTIKEIIVLHIYKNSIISLGKAGEILGLSKQEMLHLLSIRRIPINYTTDDLKSDLETLDRVIA